MPHGRSLGTAARSVAELAAAALAECTAALDVRNARGGADTHRGRVARRVAGGAPLRRLRAPWSSRRRRGGARAEHPEQRPRRRGGAPPPDRV